MVDFAQGARCSSPDACIGVIRETFGQRVDCISLLDVAEGSGNLNAYTSVGIGESADQSVYRFTVLNLPQRPRRHSPELSIAGPQRHGEPLHAAPIFYVSHRVGSCAPHTHVAVVEAISQRWDGIAAVQSSQGPCRGCAYELIGVTEVRDERRFCGPRTSHAQRHRGRLALVRAAAGSHLDEHAVGIDRRCSPDQADGEIANARIRITSAFEQRRGRVIAIDPVDSPRSRTLRPERVGHYAAQHRGSHCREHVKVDGAARQLAHYG